MSKDPAFLFYPGDWLGGTITFSRSQKGAYMDLLVAQFNQGSLSIADIKQILNTDFWMWESKLKFKFDKDENGLYFNLRLQKEIIKRRLYTDSRKDNLNRNTHMERHMDSHMENENEIILKDRIVKERKFQQPSIDEIKDYCKSRGNKVDPIKFFNFYESKGWMVGKNKMKNWQAAVRNWEQSSIVIKSSGEARQNFPDASQTDEYLKSLRK